MAHTRPAARTLLLARPRCLEPTSVVPTSLVRTSLVLRELARLRGHLRSTPMRGARGAAAAAAAGLSRARPAAAARLRAARAAAGGLERLRRAHTTYLVHPSHLHAERWGMPSAAAMRARGARA